MSPTMIQSFTHSFSFFSTLLALAFAFYYLSKLALRPKIEKTKRPPLPPGPKPWPIIGNLPEMLKKKPVPRWMHNLMEQMNTEIACIRLGNIHVIPVTCPELSREFLRTQDAVFATRPLCMSAEITSKGYLSTAFAPLSDQFKKMRRVVSNSLLSPAMLHWLYEKRAEEADHLVRYVHNQCRDPEKAGLVDVRVTARHYCGNVIRRMIFNKRYFGKGREDGGPGFEEEDQVRAQFVILDYVYGFCISDYLPCLRGLDLDGQEKIIKESVETLEKYQCPIIEERVRAWREGKKEEKEDMLDVLITLKDDNGNPLLTVDEIKAQVNELGLATVDNPSNALEWALGEMLNQPEILEKAVEELDRVVGKDRLVQEHDISQLNYIKACAREAFRLHPLSPFNVPHVAISDAVVGNYFIPKGSRVLLSRRGLGRNPKVWVEPLKFKPERHLKNDGSEVALAEPDLRFISFSTGRRGCIGVKLGTTITVMLFARILQGFTWSLPPNVPKADLKEHETNLSLAKPLVAVAKPRLAAEVYPSTN